MAYNFVKCNHVTWDVLEQTVQLRSSSSSVLWNREQKFGRMLFAGLEKKSSLKVMLQFLQVQVKFQKSTCVLLTQATFYFADIPLYNLSLFGIPRSSRLNRTFPVTNPSSYRVHHSGWQKGALLGFPSSPHKGRMKEEEATWPALVKCAFRSPSLPEPGIPPPKKASKPQCYSWLSWVSLTQLLKPFHL